MEIHHYHSIREVNQTALKSLIERSMNDYLVPDYASTVDPLFILMVQEREVYRGTMIMLPVPNLHNVTYIDKFAVDPEFRRMGLGTLLWQTAQEILLRRDIDQLRQEASLQPKGTPLVPKLFWRTKRGREGVKFYENLIEKLKIVGSAEYPDSCPYRFFFTLSLTKDELPVAMKFAKEKEPTLEERALSIAVAV